MFAFRRPTTEPPSKRPNGQTTTSQLALRPFPFVSNRVPFSCVVFLALPVGFHPIPRCATLRNRSAERVVAGFGRQSVGRWVCLPVCGTEVGPCCSRAAVSGCSPLVGLPVGEQTNGPRPLSLALIYSSSQRIPINFLLWVCEPSSSFFYRCVLLLSWREAVATPLELLRHRRRRRCGCRCLPL